MLKITNFNGMTENEIKKKVTKSKDIREYERWICINSSIKGLSPPDIAQIINRDEKTIRKWITDFNSYGEKGLKRISPQGKKKD